MKEPSDARKRILALHDRAIRFSNSINQSYPDGLINHPSRVVWDQLVRAADGTSNNLIEADAASSAADFLNKMRIALREAKESKAIIKNTETRVARDQDERHRHRRRPRIAH